MKQQIARLSPHQNGKVFAVLMAASSLVFMVPFGLFFLFAAPPGQRGEAAMFLFMPFAYLIFGYLSVAVGCAVYNFMFRYVGGIEFEATVTNGH